MQNSIFLATCGGGRSDLGRIQHKYVLSKTISVESIKIFLFHISILFYYTVKIGERATTTGDSESQRRCQSAIFEIKFYVQLWYFKVKYRIHAVDFTIAFIAFMQNTEEPTVESAQHGESIAFNLQHFIIFILLQYRYSSTGTGMMMTAYMHACMDDMFFKILIFYKFFNKKIKKT